MNALATACLSAACAAFALAQPAASAPADGVVLAPHHAVYELQLGRTNGKRGISNVRGRIIYDFSGSSCAGYELKFRQVSELDSNEGPSALSDLASTTWEDGDAKKFRFSSESKLNRTVGDVVDGHADRGAEKVAVALTKPSEKKLDIPVDSVFPTEHMRKVIAAARAGKKVLDLVVYDGSETGEKIYNTLTVIGHPIQPGSKPPQDAAAKIPEMAKLARWPVTISYFDRNARERGEQVPAYSIHFELYENGISSNLSLDYTDFSISGKLAQLDLRKSKPCP